MKNAHELRPDLQPVGERNALGTRVGNMAVVVEQMIALGNLASFGVALRRLDLERDFLQLIPGVVVK